MTLFLIVERRMDSTLPDCPVVSIVGSLSWKPFHIAVFVMLIDKEVKLSLPVLQNVLQPLEDWRRPVLDLSQHSLKDDHVDQSLGIFQAVDLLASQEYRITI